MKSVKQQGSTRDPGTRRAPVRKNPPQSERTVHHMHGPRKSLCPESVGLHLATGRAPGGGPIPPAGPVALAPPPEATAEADGDEDGHARAAALTGVTEVTAGRPVAVIPEVAHIIAAGDPGQTLMTAIQVEVAV